MLVTNTGTWVMNMNHNKKSDIKSVIKTQKCHVSVKFGSQIYEFESQTWYVHLVLSRSRWLLTRKKTIILCVILQKKKIVLLFICFWKPLMQHIKCYKILAIYRVVFLHFFCFQLWVYLCIWKLYQHCFEPFIFYRLSYTYTLGQKMWA